MTTRKLLVERLEAKEMMACDCNWGLLTSGAIADGFDQGGHASDPSGDGLGRDGVEERVGLANILERGNLKATCEFVRDNLP